MSVWEKTWQKRAEHRWNRRLTRAPKCRNLYQPKLPKARSDEWIERLAERFVYGCETETDGDELTGGEKSCRCLCAAEAFLWASSASTRCLIFDPIWNDSSAIFHPPIHLRSVQLSICHSPFPSHWLHYMKGTPQVFMAPDVGLSSYVSIVIQSREFHQTFYQESGSEEVKRVSTNFSCNLEEKLTTFYFGWVLENWTLLL